MFIRKRTLNELLTRLAALEARTRRQEATLRAIHARICALEAPRHWMDGVPAIGEEESTECILAMPPAGWHPQEEVA